jgi:hypothetical protein
MADNCNGDITTPAISFSFIVASHQRITQQTYPSSSYKRHDPKDTKSIPLAIPFKIKNIVFFVYFYYITTATNQQGKNSHSCYR